MSERAPTAAPREERITRVAAIVALIGPVLAIVGLATASGRGLPIPLTLAALASIAILAWSIARARREAPVAAGVGVVGLVALALFRASFASAPIERTSPESIVLPIVEAPEGVAAYRIETGVIHRTASFAHRGGSFDVPRAFAMNAVLVTHPSGDVLIDSGLATDVDAHLEAMPAPFRLLTDLERGVSVDVQLERLGYDRTHLLGIVLTHAHWDHVSGAADLDDVPLLVPEAERAFLDAGWITAVARSLSRDRFHTYDFDDGPALDAPRSHDLHGDGSIVIVPAPGHTPGSVMVLVTDSRARRFLFVGDVVWQREGITQREERPWLTRLGDDDADAVRARIASLAAIAEAHPEITIVPSHDARAYEALEPLSAMR